MSHLSHKCHTRRGYGMKLGFFRNIIYKLEGPMQDPKEVIYRIASQRHMRHQNLEAPR